MGEPSGRIRHGYLEAVNPRLAELLESGQFDWDDERHRAAWLKAWINAPRKQEEESLDR